jgi:hypothetical protein
MFTQDTNSQPASVEIEPWSEDFLPLIPVDHATHTPENPFCEDPSCPCHEDTDNIGMVNQAYEDGIITSGEASDIVKGVRQW